MFVCLYSTVSFITPHHTATHVHYESKYCYIYIRHHTLFFILNHIAILLNSSYSLFLVLPFFFCFYLVSLYFVRYITFR